MSRANVGAPVALLMIMFLGFSQAAVSRPTIGVVLPHMDFQATVDLLTVEAVRRQLGAGLQGQGFDVVPLQTPASGAPDAEARGKGCTHVLYLRFKQASSGGGFFKKLSGFSKINQIMNDHLSSRAPGSGPAPTLSAEQADGQIGSLQQVAVHRDDTISAEYRLLAVGSTSPLADETFDSRATSDGEDVIHPLLARLVTAVGGAVNGRGGSAAAVTSSTSAGGAAGGAGGAAAASATSAAGTAAADDAGGKRGFLSGLFNRHKAEQTATPPPQSMDCAKIASVSPSVSRESCEQMAASQRAYEQAAADPSAAHPGDEQMGCDAILAELRQQRYEKPDAAKLERQKAALANEQSMNAKQQARATREAAADQAKFEAAAAVDMATEAATLGVVHDRATNVVSAEKIATDRARAKRNAAERKDTDTQFMNSTADMTADVSKQLSDNPRLARLMQLANQRHCRGS